MERNMEYIYIYIHTCRPIIANLL